MNHLARKTFCATMRDASAIVVQTACFAWPCLRSLLPFANASGGRRPALASSAKDAAQMIFRPFARQAGGAGAEARQFVIAIIREGLPAVMDALCSLSLLLLGREVP